MSGVSDLSKEELTVLAEAVDVWEKLLELLSRIEAWPRDHQLHIETEVQPGYLGWIGYNEGGSITFQPAAVGVTGEAEK
jgi:hypothetical protein